MKVHAQIQKRVEVIEKEFTVMKISSKKRSKLLFCEAQLLEGLTAELAHADLLTCDVLSHQH